MLKNKIHAASNLTPNDWWMLFQAWVLLILFDLGLRMLPFTYVQNFAAGSRQIQKPPPSPSAEVEIQRTWRIMRIASRNHIYPMTCLRRSLALQRILNGRGIMTELRFGVDFDDYDRLATADSITAPTLIYQGGLDSTVDASIARDLATAMGGTATLVEQPEAQHVGSWNVDPEAYAAAMTTFLDGAGL